MKLTVDGAQADASTGGRPLDPESPLLVMVHGAALDKTIWQLQTRYFAHRGYSVLAVDLPGHGASGGDPLPSIGGYADWLIRVLDAAGCERAHLAGHSMGGLITLEAAARHPDRVRTLTLAGGAAAMPVHPALLEAAASDAPLAYRLMTSWGYGKRSHLGGHRTPGLWMTGAALRLWERAAPGLLWNDLRACDEYGDGPAAARAVRCPTLLITGSIDIMAPPAAAEPLREGLADWEETVIPGAGHIMMIEQPDPTLDAWADFLERRGGERPPPQGKGPGGE